MTQTREPPEFPGRFKVVQISGTKRTVLVEPSNGILLPDRKSLGPRVDLLNDCHRPPPWRNSSTNKKPVQWPDFSMRLAAFPAVHVAIEPYRISAGKLFFADRNWPKAPSIVRLTCRPIRHFGRAGGWTENSAVPAYNPIMATKFWPTFLYGRWPPKTALLPTAPACLARTAPHGLVRRGSPSPSIRT